MRSFAVAYRRHADWRIALLSHRLFCFRNKGDYCCVEIASGGKKENLKMKGAVWQHGQSIYSAQKLRKNLDWNWERRTVPTQIANIAGNYVKLGTKWQTANAAKCRVGAHEGG